MHLIDTHRYEEFTDDTNDHREIMVQLWYPTEIVQGERALYMDPVTFDWLKHQSPIPLFMIPDQAYTFVNTHAFVNVSCAPGIFPVVLFSHGYDGVRAIYTSLIEDLVSHGFIVAAINHPYIAGVTVFPDGRTVELAPVPEDSEQQTDYFETAFRAVTGDIRFTLDYLAQTEGINTLLSDHLDLDRVGIYGHSFGGGATVDVCAHDPRFSAGATLDGFFRGNATEQGLDRPLLFMLAEGRGAGSDIQMLWEKLIGNAYRAEVNGSAHYSYTDVGILLSHLAPLLPRSVLGFGSIDAERLVHITNSFLRGFFDVYLNGAPVSTILAVAEQYDDVLFAYK
jgi:dienelactone hydrolase